MDAFEELVQVVQERLDSTKRIYSRPDVYIEGRMDAYDFILGMADGIRRRAKAK